MSAPFDPDALGAPLQHALNALAHQGHQHLNEVETDLGQTGRLLAEAIDKLGKSFLGIHAAVTAQHAAIAALQDGVAVTAESKTLLEGLQHECNAHVNAAVTAMQFQDMTSQLLGRSIEHVAGLRALFAAIGAAGAALGDGAAASAQVGAVLAALNHTLDAQGMALASAARRSVAQTHLESGDIELF